MTLMGFDLSDLQRLSREHLERTCLFRCWVSFSGPATIRLKVLRAPLSLNVVFLLLLLHSRIPYYYCLLQVVV